MRSASRRKATWPLAAAAIRVKSPAGSPSMRYTPEASVTAPPANAPRSSISAMTARAICAPETPTPSRSNARPSTIEDLP
jgi:hypothetical protein